MRGMKPRMTLVEAARDADGIGAGLRPAQVP
jgi:hypothetical protein